MQQTWLLPFTMPDGFEFFGAWHFSGNIKNLMLSQEHGTIILLYNDLFREIKEKELSNDLKFKLIQRAFGGMENSRKVSSASERISPKFFIIDLTTACVLRCVYCFRHLDNHTKSISRETLSDICDFIIDYCNKIGKKRIDVQPWGGEPLLAFEHAKFIQDRLSEANLDAAVSIQTCGVLLTEALVQEAKRRRIKLGVSIDGVPELHDFHRPLRSGGGSFEKMRAGLKVLHQNGYLNNHTTITVISKQSLPFIEQIVQFFADDLGLHQFKCNVIKKNPQMQQAGLELSVKEVHEYVNRMMDALILLHRQGSKTIEVNISTKILNLLHRKCGNICTSRGCMGGRKMIAFDQDGLVFSCDTTDLKEEAFGSIYDGRSLMEMLETAVENHPFFMVKDSMPCRTCPWHFYCRGGCTSAVRYLHGAYTGGIDEMECAYNKAAYPRIVELLLNDPAMLQSLVQDELDFLNESETSES